DRHTEQDDCGAHNKNGQSMADSPEHSRPCGTCDLFLTAHDGGDRDHVVRIGGVSQPEKEADSDDGKKADHEGVVAALRAWHARLKKDCKCRAPRCSGAT